SAYLLQRVENRLPSKRRPPGQQLVEDRPQRVDIDKGTAVLARAVRQLRRHVAGRAEQAAGLRLPLFVQSFGQAKVGDLRLAVTTGSLRGVRLPPRKLPVATGEQDVGRLQVAVQDALLVGMMDASRQGRDQFGCGVARLRLAG